MHMYRDRGNEINIALDITQEITIKIQIYKATLHNLGVLRHCKFKLLIF
jgi:hypothetical protein